MSKNRTAFNTIEAFLDGRMQVPEKNYPEQVYDYPETLQKTLQLFYDIWNIPSGAIPTRRHKAKFQLWLDDLEKIANICATDAITEAALIRARRRYKTYPAEYQFIVWRPCGEGMEKLIIDAVAKIKAGDMPDDDNTKVTEQPVEEPAIEEASAEDKLNALKILSKKIK